MLAHLLGRQRRDRRDAGRCFLNRLIAHGKIHPTLSRTYTLDEVGQAALDVHHNLHQGKVGGLALVPEEGLGVLNEEMRAKHIDKINAFRGV